MHHLFKKHTQRDRLDRYSFLWSEARLLIAALALFLGGVPPLLALNPVSSLSGVLSSFLTLAWIISGVASGYLLYRWNESGRKLFGKRDQRDEVAFLVNVVTGFNLGLAGLLGTNIGMAISQSGAVFFAAGVLYLVTAYHLFRRWKEEGEELF